jgi:hypothetical protein
LGHSPLSGEPLAASAPPALAPASAGASSAELAPTAAYGPQPRPAEPPGRASHWPGAGQPPERPLTHSLEPRGGRPAEPPPAHGGSGGDGHRSGSPAGDDHTSANRSGEGSQHSEDGSPGDHGDTQSTGLTDEKRDEILAMEKGTRPDPSNYLPREYIEHHLGKFHEGATRFMPETSFDKYGIAQRDGTSFVMPKSEADALIDATRGNPRALAKALGLPEDFLDSRKLVRIDIDHPEEFHLRMPSGNEAGANEQWIPGGRLPDGASEAIVDGGKIPRSDYSVTELLK